MGSKTKKRIFVANEEVGFESRGPMMIEALLECMDRFLSCRSLDSSLSSLSNSSSLILIVTPFGRRRGETKRNETDTSCMIRQDNSVFFTFKGDRSLVEQTRIGIPNTYWDTVWSCIDSTVSVCTITEQWVTKSCALWSFYPFSFLERQNVLNKNLYFSVHGHSLY